MNNGIGKNRTVSLAPRMVQPALRAYAEGQRVKKLMAIVGEDALTETRQESYLRFSNAFERRMIGQGMTRRTIEDTLRHRLEAPRPPAQVRIDAQLTVR
jgi:V/A-type H+-transporting ATPase subunit B